MPAGRDSPASATVAATAVLLLEKTRLHALAGRIDDRVRLSPMSPDPLPFAAGAFVPWVVVQIIATPMMPAPIVFWLLWQWLQTFARAVVTALAALSDGALRT